MLAMIALGCSGPTEISGATGTLSTDASAYVATPETTLGRPNVYQFTVVTRFKNTGRTPIRLGSSPVFSVPLVSSDTSATSAYDPVWALAAHDSSITVAPGETHVDTLMITGPNVWDGQTLKPIGVMEGTYRLVYASDGCNATHGCRSNEFTVKLGE